MKPKLFFLFTVLILFFFCAIPFSLYAQTWQYLGTQYSVNNISDIAVGYAGSTRTVYGVSDKLLKTTGSSISWSRTDFSGETFVTCDPVNPLTVYSVINSYGWIAKSSDGGTTWEEIDDGISNEVLELEISPFNSSILYAGCNQGDNSNLTPIPSLYKSTDGGKTWVGAQGFPLDYPVISAIVFDPTDENYIFASSKCGNTDYQGVFRTTNNGSTWIRKVTGFGTDIKIEALAIGPASAKEILYAGTSTSHLYKSTNSGDSWMIKPYYPGSGTIKEIQVDPFSPSIVYVATSQGVVKSTDGGASWSWKNNGIADIDVHSIAVDPVTQNLIYAGSLSQFYYSSDGGDTWINASIDPVAAGGIAVYNDDVYVLNKNKNTILATKFVSSSSIWEVSATQGGTDVSFAARGVAIDPTNPDKLYGVGERQDPIILRSTNGGQHWNEVYSHIGGVDGVFFNDVAIDPNLATKVYAVANRNRSNSWYPELWYSTNSGTSWTSATYGGTLAVADYYSVIFDKNSGTSGNASQQLFAGGGPWKNGDWVIHQPVLVQSTDAGITWSTYFLNGSYRYITSLAQDPNNSNILYGAYMGETKSYPGGIFKFTFNNENLLSPELTLSSSYTLHHVVSIVHHPLYSNILYMAEEADQGDWKISYTADGGENWTEISAGIPSDIPIYRLAFKANIGTTCPQYLYAATDVGVYRLDISTLSITTITTSLGDSWNLVSVPNQQCDYSKSSVWPTASSNAFSYTGGYTMNNPVQMGRGYFVKFSSSQEMNYNGVQLNSMDFNVNAGWNIIGSLSTSVPVGNISATGTSLLSLFYGYTPGTGYFIATAIEPGKGYWIKVSNNGYLTLNASASQNQTTANALNSFGSTTISGDVPNPPPSPYQISPAYGSVGLSPTAVTLIWSEPFMQADSFTVQYYTDDSTFTLHQITDTTCTISNLAFHTTYPWRVRAYGESTNAWSAEWIFTTGGPPDIPSLASPANNAPFVNLPATLTWGITQYTDTYHLQVALDTNFTSPIVTDSSGIADTAFVLSGLSQATTYYWRVSGINTFGEGVWSGVQSFTTGTIPPPPSLVSPSNNATSVGIASTVLWGVTGTAVSYHLQVDLDTNFTSPVFIDSSGLTDTSFVLSGLSYSTKYFWRVQGNNSFGEGSYSLVQSFTTGAQPASPAMISPNNDAVVSNPPRLTWHRVTGAASYRVQLSTVSNFASIFRDSSGITDSTKVFNGLPGATVYYWRAKTVTSDNGESNWSGTRSLKVTPPPPPQITGNAYNTGGGILYPKPTWTAVTGWGTVQYKLYRFGFGASGVKYTGSDLYYIDNTITIGEGDVYVYYHVVSFSTLDNVLSAHSDTVEYVTDQSTSKQGIKNNTGTALPTEISLSDNFPNPFNPVTTIYFALPEDINIKLTVFNTLGKEVAVLRDGFESAGYKSATFDACDLPSGVYYYRLQAGTFSDVKKMILMK